MRYALRVLTLETVMETKEVLTHKLPVVLRGTLPQLNRHAFLKGYRWRKSSNIFGGYYVDKITGNCYYIT